MADSPSYTGNLHRQANGLYFRAHQLEHQGLHQIHSPRPKTRSAGHNNLRKSTELRTQADNLIHQDFKKYESWNQYHHLGNLEGGDSSHFHSHHFHPHFWGPYEAD